MAENSTAITDEIAPGSALASETSSGSASDGFWDSIREALRGSHRDFTTGPIGRSLLILAIPMVLEMCMESVFAVVDMFWVSHLGTDAMATVGITESMLTLMYAVAICLGIGATAMVARRIGEGNPEGAARAAVQAIAVGIIVSLLFAVIGVSFSGKLLAVMGGSPGVVSQGAGFTKVMFAGNASILLLFLINAIFRGAGDAAIAMRVLWLANSINILLGPCLIVGLGPFPKLGVVVAAVAATMVGQALGAKKPDRAEQAVWKAGFYSMIFLGIVGLVFVLFARQIISLYGSDPKVIPYGADCLRIVAYGFLFYAYGMVLTQSFNGAGDTRTPTVINLFVFWLWELPLGYVLAIVFGLGPRGVFIAITVAFSTLALVSGLLFRRGRWKTRVV